MGWRGEADSYATENLDHNTYKKKQPGEAPFRGICLYQNTNRLKRDRQRDVWQIKQRYMRFFLDTKLYI